jgi:hypothetical protein
MSKMNHLFDQQYKEDITVPTYTPTWPYHFNYTGCQYLGKSVTTIQLMCQKASTNQDHPDIRITEVSPEVWVISSKTLSGCRRAYSVITEMIKQWKMSIKKTTSLKNDSDFIKI